MQSYSSCSSPSRLYCAASSHSTTTGKPYSYTVQAKDKDPHDNCTQKPDTGKPLSQAVIEYISDQISLPASTTDNCIACNARHSCLRRLEIVRLTDSDGTSPYGQSFYYAYERPNIRKPSCLMLIAAFTSRLWSAPHAGQVHQRMLRSLIKG